MLAFKLMYPKSVHLNRGNHEDPDVNARDGFHEECITKYNSTVFRAFGSFWAYLPLATVIGNKVYVVHGGIHPEAGKDGAPLKLDTIAKIDRFHRSPPDSSLLDYVL